MSSIPVSILPPNTPPTQPAIEKLTWDAHEVAARIGWHLRTVRAWDAEGRMPRPIRLGRKVVWLADDIRLWLASAGPDGVLPNRLDFDRLKKARGRIGGGR